MSIVNKVKSKPYKSSHVHMFNIKIPIVQKVLDIYTPQEVETLADYIVSLGDVQKKKTNVKAPMSDWHLNEDHHLVDRLCKKALEIISLSSNEETNFNAPKFYIRRCWGAAYGKGDWTKVHNHGASAFGWCHYVRMPKGASPICFPEADLTIHPQEGELIIFPGIVEHSVPPSDIEEKRIMIASNVGIK